MCYLKKCDFYGFLTWLSAFGDFVIDMALFWHCYVIVLSLFFALLIFGDVRFLPILKAVPIGTGGGSGCSLK